MTPICTITGHVAEPAQSRCTTAGEWLLQVDLFLEPVPKRKAVTARAIKRYGTGAAAAEVCRQTAHLLRRGMRVSVSFGAASLRAGRLELGGVDRIAADVPTYIKPFK